MQELDDRYLESMSVKELQELLQAIDAAVRANIRKRSEIRTAESLNRSGGPAAAALTPAATSVNDLERERDAWMAARSRSPSR